VVGGNLKINGSVNISGNIYIAQNAIISGSLVTLNLSNLSVTQIQSQNLMISDNFISINEDASNYSGIDFGPGSFASSHILVEVDHTSNTICFGTSDNSPSADSSMRACPLITAYDVKLCTGNLNISCTASINTLNANIINTGSLFGNYADITNILAASITTTNISAAFGNITELLASSIGTTNLFASNVFATNVIGSLGSFDTLQTSSLVVAASMSNITETSLCDAVGEGCLLTGVDGPNFTLTDSNGNFIRFVMVWNTDVSPSGASGILVERASNYAANQWEVLNAHF